MQTRLKLFLLLFVLSAIVFAFPGAPVPVQLESKADLVDRGNQ
jgi:hypothetical protein